MRERSIQDRSAPSPRAVRSTRRKATVTISVPDASCAAFITACDGYLPAPTTRREWNVRPAMTSGAVIRLQLTKGKRQKAKGRSQERIDASHPSSGLEQEER